MGIDSWLASESGFLEPQQIFRVPSTHLKFASGNSTVDPVVLATSNGHRGFDLRRVAGSPICGGVTGKARSTVVVWLGLGVCGLQDESFDIFVTRS
jgi:hypothetical protein